MDAARSQNLKKLLDAVPAGYLVDAAWLVSQGIAYESFRDYVKRGWLHRITTRYCLNRLRDQRRRNGLFQLHVAPKLPMTAASAPAEMMMLRWLLGNADERQAQAAIYVHLDGMSHEAAAALMGVSKRTVGNLLERLQTFCDQQVAEPTTPVRPSRPALTARTAREGAAPRRRPPS